MHEERKENTSSTSSTNPSTNPSTDTNSTASAAEPSPANHQERPESIPQAPQAIVNSANIFQTLQVFVTNCRADKRITPHTQLVYRVLIDLANRAYWTFPFEASDNELKTITHITSNDTLNHCKRTLKNLGYISFHGKPSKYTLYSPAVKETVKKAVKSATPHTPRSNTYKTATQNQERKEKEKKEGIENADVHNNRADRRSAEETAAFKARLKAEYEKRKRRFDD